MNDRKIGVILINLGSPDAPTPTAVRVYLAEFLSDPRVIDLHPIARWLLLHLFILPLRPKRTARAYQKIWTEEGSPLITYTRLLTQQVSANLEKPFRVAFAMRYGKPSIESMLKEMIDGTLEKLVVIPLFPQYSNATTGSIATKVKQIRREIGTSVKLEILPPFYRNPGFISAFARRGKPHLTELKPNHILFSFHGLPERQIRKAEQVPGYCLSGDLSCCSHISDENAGCYRAQCFETARLIARALQWAPADYTVTFQSRLGITPWIGPYTDKKIIELAQKGAQRLLVFCPAFVADCLETLEEIGIRGKESFLKHGGEKLVLVPSLNADCFWAEVVSKMVTDVVPIVP